MRNGEKSKPDWKLRETEMDEREHKRIHVTSLAVKSIATREEQEDLDNVFTFIKLRRKSNPNKL